MNTIRKRLCAVICLSVGILSAAEIHNVTAPNGTAFTASVVWADGNAPSPENDYVFDRANGTVDSGFDTVVFGGNSFTLKTFLGIRATSLEFPLGGLILGNKADFRYWNTAKADRSVAVTGSVTRIVADNENSASLRTVATWPGTTTFDFQAPLEGSAGSQLLLIRYTTRYHGNVHLNIRGDASSCFSTICLKGEDDASANTNAVVLCARGAGEPQQHFAGTFKLTHRLVFGCEGDVSVARVDASGEGIAFRSDGGKMRITESVSLPADVRVHFPIDGFMRSTRDDQSVCILEVPTEKGTLAGTTFTPVLSDGAFYMTALVSAAVSVVEEDGCSRLYLTPSRRIHSVIELLSTDSSVGHGSSFLERNATNWTDNAVPHAGAVYHVRKDIQLMTSANVTTFNGEELFVDGRLALCGPSFAVGSLVLKSGARVYSYTHDARLWGGTVELLGPGDVRVMGGVRSGHGILLDSEIRGGANLVFTHDTGQDPSRSYSPRGTNMAFTGEVTTAIDGGNACWDSSGGTMGRIPITVSDPRNLGGPLPAFNYKAFAPSIGFIFRPLRSMIFTEPTRGFRAYIETVIDVPTGVTLGFHQPCTWEGICRKTGPGTFAMGGPLVFTWEQLDTPPSNGLSNRLDIAEGWLMPHATNACDGLALTFADGAGIKLDLTLEATDPARVYGLYDVRWASPFTATGAGGRIALTFTDDAPERTTTVGVATVATRAMADALRDQLTVVRPAMWGKVHGITLQTCDNADGTATVAVTISRSGMLVVIR